MNLLDPLALLTFLHLNFCQNISCSCLVPPLKVIFTCSTSTKKKHNMGDNGTETDDLSSGKEYNDCMMKKAKEFIKTMLESAYVIIVTPDSLLKMHKPGQDAKIKASKLTIGFKAKVSDGKVDYTSLVGSNKFHFCGIKFTEVYPEPNEEISKTLLDPFDKVDMIAVRPHVVECEREILCRCDRLLDKGDKLRIRNETELRYAIGDPILEMLCNVGGYKVCVGCLGGEREGGE